MAEAVKRRGVCMFCDADIYKAGEYQRNHYGGKCTRVNRTQVEASIQKSLDEIEANRLEAIAKRVQDPALAAEYMVQAYKVRTGKK